jgi:phosphatidylinositol glycan class O
MAEDLDRGEVLLLERPEETLSQLLMLVSKYLALQSVRYLGTALAATILRRHLMVWKIFAPRFIFESAGFVVSALSVIAGYALVVRILSATSRYYKRLDHLSPAV